MYSNFRAKARQLQTNIHMKREAIVHTVVGVGTVCTFPSSNKISHLQDVPVTSSQINIEMTKTMELAATIFNWLDTHTAVDVLHFVA